jgi:hypothetical protein
MLIKIGLTLALVALSAPAFAQTFGGFEPFEGRDNKGRNNIPPQYRTQPNGGYMTAKPTVNPYTGQDVPAPTFGGTYGNTYNGTYNSTYGILPSTGR